jgi:hypothetical protein
VRRLLLLAALLGAPAWAADAPVAVRAHAEPDSVTIGTPFRYIVDVVADPNAEVLLEQPAERLGDFDIVDFGIDPPVARDGRKLVSRWYRLVGWRPGQYVVKTPPVRYRAAGAEPREITGQEVRVSVESVLAREPNATDIRDVKPPEAVPIDWRPWWVLASTLVALFAAGAILYRVLNRPRRARPGPPPIPPHEIAGRALADLKRRDLIGRGAFKEYYSRLSDIVRVYLEQRFHLRAPEMTTEEFLLTAARDGRLDGAHRRLLADFLAESDLVKFARHLPTIADSERAWEAASRFVQDTSRSPEELRAAG